MTGSEIDSANLVTGRLGVTWPMRLLHTMQKGTRALKVCDVFRAILSQRKSLRSLEACADVHNTKETTHNWEDTETQRTTACNRHARAPSKRLPRVGTTDHKRTLATLQLNGLQDQLTHVQLYSSPIAAHVKPPSTYLGCTSPFTALN